MPKPSSLSHADCAAGLASGLRAYTAFHTQASLVPGNIVLVTAAASVSYLIGYKFLSGQIFVGFCCYGFVFLVILQLM